MKATYVDMSIKDIIGDIRANYSTGITLSKAWRAKHLIGVDGCHLKSKFGGQMLIVVDTDLNDQYMPIVLQL